MRARTNLPGGAPTWLRFGLFAPWSEVLAHGITERTGRDGESFDLSSRTAGELGPQRLSAAAADLGFAAVARPAQVHGARISEVTGSLAPGIRVEPECDALMTATGGVLLGALFADCVPVLLLDPTRPAVAIIHAGWRGAVASIVPATIAALSDTYGVDPGHLRAGIGPAIGPCCFEVGQEVIDRFASSAAFAPNLVLPGPGDRPHLDLWTFIARQLRQAGVRAEHIERVDLCTRCQVHRFFSFRAEGPGAGRLAGFIGLTVPQRSDVGQRGSP